MKLEPIKIGIEEDLAELSPKSGDESFKRTRHYALSFKESNSDFIS